MKKKQIILSVIGVILACAVAVAVILAPRKEPEVDRNEIVTVYCVSEIRFATDDREQQISYTMEYDDYGNLIACTRYSSMVNDDSSRTNYCEYDERGNCTLRTLDDDRLIEYVYDGEDRVLRQTTCWDGEVHEEYTYTYDEAGRTLKYTSLRYGNYDEVIYTYDAKGRVLTKTEISDTLETVERYTYDAKGNKTRVDTEKNGQPYRTESWTYDRKGRVLSRVVEYVEETTYDTNSSGYYQYDTRGNELSYKLYRHDKLQGGHNSTYDVFGRLKTREIIDNGNLTQRMTFTYDIRGNLIRQESRERWEGHEDMRQSVITFQYDKDGRMTQRVIDVEGMGESRNVWYYDQNGNLLVEEHNTGRVERTYDQWGNILTKFEYSDYTSVWKTYYSYVSFQVPRWMAEKIMAQQEPYIDLTGMVLFG